MNLWLTIAAAGLVTYLIRLSFIAVHGRVVMPQWFTRALTFVPVAVLSAIILPDLLTWQGNLTLSGTNPRLLGGMAAALVAWRTRSVWLTILVGMLVLFALQMLFYGGLGK